MYFQTDYRDVVLVSSKYERELKGVLQGEEEVLQRYGRSLPPEDRPKLDGVRRSPFLVIRAAGSLGFDLVALRSGVAFPLEVKASRSDTIRFSSASGRAAQQLIAHRAAVDRVGLMVVYAYRRIGERHESWRVYTASAGPLNGKAELIRKRLPRIQETRSGNGVLRWSEGKSLAAFLEELHYLTSPIVAAPA
jgi:hypothetical protein